MVDYKEQFLKACKRGQLEEAIWLVHEYQIDVHMNNEQAFRRACEYGQIEIAKWLVQDHQVNVHVKDEYAFRQACIYIHDKIIKWFTETYKYSQSPYYYHKQTAYILNHKPLNEWRSCTILDCPVIYFGDLDKEAVIAYMASLRRPKSARS